MVSGEAGSVFILLIGGFAKAYVGLFRKFSHILELSEAKLTVNSRRAKKRLSCILICSFWGLRDSKSWTANVPIVVLISDLSNAYVNTFKDI